MDQFFQFVTEHYILSTLWIVVFVMLVMDIMKKRFSSLQPLKPQEAVLKTNRGGVFVDVRTDDEFAKGHIAGSKHLPLAKIRAGDIKTLEKFKDAPIVMVCNYGNTARTAGTALVKAGFSQVYVLQGGLQAWQGASLPVNKAQPKKQNKKKS
ncbi:rhodanese-like domain-containing protein [Aliidiomarina halalkaliphila]|uniref:Rhodanese-like domain-containing protein n=1 Tax=Aliidiomarina halalkaliphila TaxID=2593535 RepID=A0A552X1T0_9GAMM|nr:rhodanese-like domain-containing protein [Aliidiomarina halalkaliphila]TRW48977.1 rhodanese-like domain-containing protein [Aliidiomarina halalkaliphila]